jgi:hypothetical protein
MSARFANAVATAHPVCGENGKKPMAKAVMAPSPQSGEPRERGEKEAYGRVLRTVQHVLGKSRKEMADLLGVDERQLGRWYDGSETAQVWRYHRHMVARRTLRLVESLDDADGCTVEINIRSLMDLGTKAGGE